jgi:hypothetical protein
MLENMCHERPMLGPVC